MTIPAFCPGRGPGNFLLGSTHVLHARQAQAQSTGGKRESACRGGQDGRRKFGPKRTWSKEQKDMRRDDLYQRLILDDAGEEDAPPGSPTRRWTRTELAVGDGDGRSHA